ncbi:MAG: phenylacetate--CoA ligase family protein [Muribaculaceae bacterium]|nr:phenylacetate--CoA ligase family protein [Muribaculaceae bacterium]
MNLLEKTRARLFWLKDRLAGGKVRQGLDLLQQVEGGSMSEADIDRYHHQQLNTLLSHCVKTVPAYLGLKPNITSWPVVNKHVIKQNLANHFSTSFDKKSLIAMSTSGSTGTPFTSWQDIGKKRHVNAEVLFYNGKIGYSIGRRIIYFRSVVNEVAKSSLQQFMQNIYLIDCSDLSDESISAKLKQIKSLTRKTGAMILSYASTLDAFRRYFDKHGTSQAADCNIYGIVSGSEMLHEYTRKSLSQAFNCKVVSRYANEENGFIGQDDTLDNTFLNNRANYYIEILKIDSDQPADIGEIGRIVVTDLYNYSMPMIRYDTGDVGAWHYIEYNGVKRKAIGAFGGRKVDITYDCHGNAISPFAITNNMWKFQNIKQFQFIQRGFRNYLLKINTDHDINELELIETYKKIVGDDGNITIEYCSEIPVLASGKRRYIVNEMNCP